MITGAHAEFHGDNHYTVMLPIHHRNGDTSVTVQWSEEDHAWLATVSPLVVAFGGHQTADGDTPTAALCELAISLCAIIDALNNDK